MSLEEALHKLNLPSFKSDKVIHFRKHVDKVSLNADELNLVELCDDYYNGIYPTNILKEKLKSYGDIQNVIIYIFNKRIKNI